MLQEFLITDSAEALALSIGVFNGPGVAGEVVHGFRTAAIFLGTRQAVLALWNRFPCARRSPARFHEYSEKTDKHKNSGIATYARRLPFNDSIEKPPIDMRGQCE